MNTGDKVSFLEAMLCMRENPGTCFEDEKAQYTVDASGRLWQQHRSDRHPHNFGGDWNGSSWWTTWTAPQVLSSEKKFTCMKL